MNILLQLNIIQVHHWHLMPPLDTNCIIPYRHWARMCFLHFSVHCGISSVPLNTGGGFAPLPLLDPIAMLTQPKISQPSPKIVYLCVYVWSSHTLAFGIQIPFKFQFSSDALEEGKRLANIAANFVNGGEWVFTCGASQQVNKSNVILGAHT